MSRYYWIYILVGVRIDGMRKEGREEGRKEGREGEWDLVAHGIFVPLVLPFVDKYFGM